MKCFDFSRWRCNGSAAGPLSGPDAGPLPRAHYKLARVVGNIGEDDLNRVKPESRNAKKVLRASFRDEDLTDSIFPLRCCKRDGIGF